MPIFEYSCRKCGHRFEKLQKAGIPHQTECPACGSADVEKELSTFSSASAECFSGG